MCYILGCLEGNWKVSGGRMSDSGCCLVGCDLQEMKKHPVRLIFIILFLFSQLPRIGHNVPYFGVSVGCLGGVWEVPRGCLSDSGYCQGVYGVD